MFTVRALFAVAAAVLLGGTVALASTVSPVVRVSPAGHTVGQFASDTSPHNPQLMVASATDNDLGSRWRCAVYISTNGGSAWSEVNAWPLNDRIQPTYDPWVVADSRGILHATCVASIDKNNARIVYTRSTDNGATWTAPSVIPRLSTAPRNGGADKSVLTVADDGALYVCFSHNVDMRGTKGLVVARSTDNGANWAVKDTGLRGVFCNGMIRHSSSSLTIAYSDYALGGRYGTVTSTSNGDTWSPPTVLGNTYNAIPNMPSIVADSTGSLRVAQLDSASVITLSTINSNGGLGQQWQLSKPSSPTCSSGRSMHEHLIAAPGAVPALHTACKVSPTPTTPGRLEVWLYPDTNPGTTTPPAQIIGMDLSPGPAPTTQFGQAMIDGGDYWVPTWRSGGWQPMWIDPRTGGGPGELQTVAVTP